MRILYLQPSYEPPSVDVRMDRFFLLSEHLEGDVLQPIWTAQPEQVAGLYGEAGYPVYTCGKFRYHWLLEWPHRGLRSDLAVWWFFLRKGLALHRENPYDCIIAYSHLTPALLGGFLKLLTGAKLIVEIATSPNLSFLNNRPRPTMKDRLGRLYSDFCLYLTVKASAQVHLLYKTQLDAYKRLRRIPSTIFHEFVPMSAIQRGAENPEKTVLLVGAPWYLKGADVLVKAFLRLSADYPDAKLKLVGHFPDGEALKEMTKGCSRIEIVKAMGYRETLKTIGESWVLVLPSRTEGMGRVLLEAMGAGVPVIGSDAGGIPSYIEDGEYGFVFRSGDVEQLESQLRRILSDSGLRHRLGERAYAVAHEKYTEQVYTAQFTRMVRAAVEGPHE
jgi:glycosyltransferase involved in cell wall biosynthesis